jgi:hypothetical protein
MRQRGYLHLQHFKVSDSKYRKRSTTTVTDYLVHFTQLLPGAINSSHVHEGLKRQPINMRTTPSLSKYMQACCEVFQLPVQHATYYSITATVSQWNSVPISSNST